jgi:hypothetical protein
MKVAILLSGIGWDRAPFDDATVDVWTCNDEYRLHPPRISRHFELHRPEDWYLSDDVIPSADVPRGRYLRPCDHLDHLASLGVPIDMQEACADVPRSVPYPLAAVILAAGGVRLFDSSLAYMLGLCLLERPSWIGIYGANLSGPEYQDQRPTAQWLLGLLVGGGADVYIEQPSTLLACTHLYAYEPAPRRIPDDVRRGLVKALNSREALVQTWIDGADPSGDERQRVTDLDAEIGAYYATLAQLGLSGHDGALAHALEMDR